jgi:outer membrane protein OmpA-like peptidoglycan-associated protein
MSIRVRLTLLPGLALAALALGALPSSSEAQFGKRLKDAVKRTAEDKAIQKATTEESKAIDGAIEGGAAAKPDSAAETSAAQPAAGAADAAAGGTGVASQAAPAPAAAPAAAPPKKAGEGAFVSFDFVPGDRVLFYDDYTSDNVGDFPRRFEFEDGNAEVADWEGGKWLRVSKSTKFTITLPEVLPQRFTVEFDFVTNHTASNSWPVMLNVSGAESNWEGQGSSNPTVRWSYSKGGAYVGKIEAEGPAGAELQDKVNRARIMADGKYTKVYFNGVRVANAPNADLGRSNKVQFWVPGYDPAGVQATMIGPIRIAAGGKKLYDALSEKGRVATQGIYFDTGSDGIRQESAPTLKEIGTMLKEHVDLKLTIEGHTDNVGKAESNQTLSEKRAAAVRQYLIDTYQIDGARLEAKGLGQSKPVGTNDTAEGRQQNRRVELVKK